jgi:hypothetical protein
VRRDDERLADIIEALLEPAKESIPTYIQCEYAFLRLVRTRAKAAGM